MTDDLVERVARIIEAKRSFLPSDRLAREIVVECFRLRDMKDAPRDGRWLVLSEGISYVVACWSKQESTWIINAPGFPDLFNNFEPTGWLPLPKGNEP